MKIKISTFHSYLHESNEFNNLNNVFLKDIEKELGENIIFSDLEDYDCDIKLIFIESGGSEGYFLENFNKLKEPFYLLTSGTNNSLAASLEILTYLNNKMLVGEVLHGDSSYIANRIKTLINGENKTSKRLGVIGKPSDWLIASIPNYNDISKKFNYELIDIPIVETVDLFNTFKTNENEEIKANNYYQVLNRIKNKYNLDGLTIRCFDLLDSIRTTGCLALANLNSEGCVSACEGDIMAMVSMQIVHDVIGVSSFMANPSRIDTKNNTILFAHCTIPFDMVSEYQYMTHFESGIGVAIRGKLDISDITIFRLSKDLKHYYVEEGKIIKNLSEDNLCRTQILVKIDGDVTKLLKEPCGNHHIIFYGRYKEQIEKYLKKVI